MVGIIIGIIALFVALVIIVILMIKRRRFEIINVEELEFADLLKFFKRPEILKELKSSPNYIGVAIKENTKVRIRVVACIFDKEKNTVVEFDKPCRWNAKRLSEDVAEAFADKDMIILS